MAYQTGSLTSSEFTCILSTACDRNQLAYCSHSKARNFAQESPIEKIKVPFWSAINLLSDSVLMSVSTKCGKWVLYSERVTFFSYQDGLSWHLRDCQSATWLSTGLPWRTAEIILLSEIWLLPRKLVRFKPDQLYWCHRPCHQLPLTAIVYPNLTKNIGYCFQRHRSIL